MWKILLISVSAACLALALPLAGQEAVRYGIVPNPDSSLATLQEPQRPLGAQVEEQAHRFKGKIVAAGQKLVLEGDERTVYELDDQARAKPFEGKRVMVFGTLDEHNTIHVTDIRPVERTA